MHTVPPIFRVQLMARVSGLSAAFSGYSRWLVCLTLILQSLGTAAGSCACPQYCSLWVQLLARVPAICAAVSIRTAAGSCGCPQYCILWVQLLAPVPALCTAVSGYSCWLVCLLSVLQSLYVQLLAGLLAGWSACPQYCSLCRYSCWLVCLPSVLQSLGTADGSCGCCLCCFLWTSLFAGSLS